jgi:hypothetical protein
MWCPKCHNGSEAMVVEQGSSCLQCGEKEQMVYHKGMKRSNFLEKNPFNTTDGRTLHNRFKEEEDNAKEIG